MPVSLNMLVCVCLAQDLHDATEGTNSSRVSTVLARVRHIVCLVLSSARLLEIHVSCWLCCPQADEIKALYPSTKVFPMRFSTPSLGAEAMLMRHRDSVSAYEDMVVTAGSSKPKQSGAGGGAGGQRNKDKARRASMGGPIVSRSLIVQRPASFRPGWWTAPQTLVPLSVDDAVDPLEVGPALGLRPGVLPEFRTVLAHRMGVAMGPPEHGAMYLRG